MAVRIRMKRLGRKNRAFYRICAMDIRRPRDGKVLEELGYYDPSVSETDARAILRADRIDYWLGVGAQPSDKVRVLIKKYGTNGTHTDAQVRALEKLKLRPSAPPPVPIPRPAAPAPQNAESAEGTASEEDDHGEPSAAESGNSQE